MANEEQSIQDLLASLRASSSASKAQSSSKQASSVPAATLSRSVSEATLQPSVKPHLRAAPPSFTTPQSDQGPDRTANLLNLLKSNQNGQLQQPDPSSENLRSSSASMQSMPATPATQNIHGRGVSASDLVASFMGKPASSMPPATTTPSPAPELSTASSANPQDYLLQLLNRTQAPKVSQPGRTSQTNIQKALTSAVGSDMGSPTAEASKQTRPITTGAKSQCGATRTESPIRIFGTTEGKEPTPFDPRDLPTPEHQAEPASNPIFTYVNPFEQLAASSPRNVSSRSGNATPLRDSQNLPHRVSSYSSSLKNKDGLQTPTSKLSRPHQNPTANGSEILQSIESPDPPRPLDNERGQVEALLGIGAPTTDTSTVAQALNDVSEQVSRQADYAVAQAEEENKAAEAQQQEESKAKGIIHGGSSEVKHKPEADDHEDSFNTVVPDSMVDNMEQALEDTARNAQDVHGSADDEKSSANGDDEYIVPVYNFPMRPFTNIELTQDEPPQNQFRAGNITDIARLKKEFDQIDRTLATASTEYITYAMPKPGGIRVIRQDDGMDRQIFKETRDHVFNVALSTGIPGKSAHDLQASIATAVSGTVYWTALHHNVDNIEDVDIEKHCLIFPPISAHEDHTSGGQLKTRAKKSSRHPEFFAIGRGKSIQLVWPLHAARFGHVNSKRMVDTEAYFKSRSLKINTGKAGKDFTFSEDDTVIATLDKAGRLRFWDIRELVHPSNNETSHLDPVEIRTPILTFSTSIPSEKSWPTSVLFVDKLRAYAKGIALRYVIVGMKQNHTLQLWDLGIGKAIQEVSFPHSKESDAICSVVYHAATSMIIVGHPTRNSIYFIHLSAPKYNLQPMTQARYLTRVADKDSSLPKLDATAIMSGVRELSFESKGQLRSLDLLPLSSNSPMKEDGSLFELYIMHSKGVTCLDISSDELGWDEDGKTPHAKDAETSGLVKIKEIVQPPALLASESSSVNGDTDRISTSTKSTVKEIPKKGTSSKAPELNSKAITDGSEAVYLPDASTQNSAAPSPEKQEKRKKKKGGASAEDPSVNANVPPPAPVAPSSYANAASKAMSSTQSVVSTKDSSRTQSKKRATESSESKRGLADSESISLGISTDFIDKEMKKIESNVSVEFSKVLNLELDALYHRLSEDKRVQEAQMGGNQEALLRLVSSSLGDNVEKNLNRMITNSIKKDVIPSIYDSAVTTVQKEVQHYLNQNINGASFVGQLRESIDVALLKPEVIRSIAEQVTSKVSSVMEKQLKSSFDKQIPAAFEKTVVPSFKDLTFNAALKMSKETEKRVTEQVDRAQKQNRIYESKIDQLTNVIRTLSDTVQSMAAAQSSFQAEILKSQQFQPHEETPRSRRDGSNSSKKSLESEQLSPAAKELNQIKVAMEAGNFEEGTILWLQSQNQASIFDDFFVDINPEYLHQCSPLVTLSVAAAVTASLEKNIAGRLEWLNTVLSSIDARDPEIQDVAPKIMEVLCQRLESRFMELSELDNTNPVLRSFPHLTRKARDISNRSRA